MTLPALLASLASLAILGACAATSPTPAPRRTSQAPEPVGPPTQLRDRSIEVSMRLAPGPVGAVEVEIIADGPAAELGQWSRPRAGPLRGLAIDDASGAVPHTVSPTRVQLGRDVSPPVVVRYTLDRHAAMDPTAAVDVAQDHFFVAGESALLLPALDASSTIPTVVTVAPCGTIRAASASSFGTDARIERRLSTRLLRRASFACGDLDVAHLDTAAGADHVIAMPGLAYDPRWAAAEVAIIRSEVDRYFGASEPAAFTTMLRSDNAAPHGPRLRANLRSSSMVVRSPANHAWDVRLRVAVAEALVRRWLDGVFAFEQAPANAEMAAWWTHGIARFVAFEVLVELGLLDASDYAAALGEAEVVLARRNRVSNDRSELAAAHGWLLALGLDHRLRAQQGSVRGLLVGLLAGLQGQARRTIRPQDWNAAVASALGPEATAFAYPATLQHRPSVAAEVLEPCLRPRRQTLRVYELGLIDPRIRGEPLGPVQGLEPGGPAAAAGIQPGDHLEALEYAPQDLEVEVQVVVKRGTQAVPIRFRPRFTRVRAVVWNPSPRATPETCR